MYRHVNSLILSFAACRNVKRNFQSVFTEISWVVITWAAKLHRLEEGHQPSDRALIYTRAACHYVKMVEVVKQPGARLMYCGNHLQG